VTGYSLSGGSTKSTRERRLNRFNCKTLRICCMELAQSRFEIQICSLTILLIVALNVSTLAEVTRCCIQARVLFLSRLMPMADLILNRSDVNQSAEYIAARGLRPCPLTLQIFTNNKVHPLQFLITHFPQKDSILLLSRTSRTGNMPLFLKFPRGQITREVDTKKSFRNTGKAVQNTQLKMNT